MKKVITLSLFIFLVLETTLAVSSNTKFTINAYKVGTYNEEHVSMEAYDALEENLTKIASNDKLDLSPYTSNLKNNSDDDSYSVEPYNRHVIFSFQVDGNCNGNYTLSVTIGPLQHVDSEGNTLSSNTITAYYEMRDVSCVFTSTYKSTGAKGGKTTTPYLSPSSFTISNASNVFVSTWTISNITSGQYENWRAQGSVGISINRESYKNAADKFNGLYMADVTIKLEVGS